MVSQTDNKVCLSLMHQSKQVKVTLTFPKRSDQKAEQEFINRLKAVYLEKVENGAMQKGGLALQSPATKQQSSESAQNDCGTLNRRKNNE